MSDEKNFVKKLLEPRRRTPTKFDRKVNVVLLVLVLLFLVWLFGRR